jgi:RNA polymerase sigma-70 factor (ECF subfamily)
MSTGAVTIASTGAWRMTAPIGRPSVRETVADETEASSVEPLVAEARAGSREAFSTLVARHQQVAVRTAMAALGRKEDAEDAAQDAFVLAWRKLPQFRGDSSFRTWLVAIVWRRALSRRRRLSLARPFRRDRFDEDAVRQLADRGPDPERTALARDMARRAAAQIARLSPTLRDTLLLAASGEHSYEAIGRLLGVPIGTVKWRVSEARRLVTAGLQSRPKPRT